MIVSWIVSIPLAGKSGELAQNYTRPPADLGNGDFGYDPPPQENAAGLVVRIDRLENQIRQLNGQVEQLQFANHRLEDQLKKFQADVDFRFQEGSGRGGSAPAAPAAPAKVQPKRTEVLPGDYEMGSEAPRAAEDPIENELSQDNAGLNETRPRRHDAFDPSSNPAAPGSPQSLGTLADGPASAEQKDPNAPLDLAGGRLAPKPSQATQMSGMSASVPLQVPQNKAAATASQNQTMVAALPPGPQRDEFATALSLFRQKEYENAGKGFAAYLQKNPQSKLSADALYYLGETYFLRGRQREAAEEFLKISTHYAASSRAPEAMLRLGQSLLALGAHEQACATFGEVPHKYPNAAANVKAGAEREARRAQC